MMGQYCMASDRTQSRVMRDDWRKSSFILGWMIFSYHHNNIYHMWCKTNLWIIFCRCMPNGCNWNISSQILTHELFDPRSDRNPFHRRLFGLVRWAGWPGEGCFLSCRARIHKNGPLIHIFGICTCCPCWLIYSLFDLSVHFVHRLLFILLHFR